MMWEKSSISYQLCNRPVLHNSCILTLWLFFFYIFHPHLIFWEGKNKQKKVQTSVKIPLLKSGGSGRSVGGGEEGRRRPCSSAVFDLSPLLGSIDPCSAPFIVSAEYQHSAVFFLQSAEAEARRRPRAVVSSIEFSSFFFSVDLPGGTFSQNSGFYLWWREKSPKGNTRRNHQSAAWQES